MMLPDKHISLGDSLLGVGAHLLEELDHPRSVSYLWNRVRDSQDIATFERFALALSMLHSMGLVDIENGAIKKTER
jgi:hypothetical protein